MAIFESTEKMYEVLGGLFEGLMANPDVLEKSLKANLTVLFNISEPSGQIWLSPYDGGKVVCGPADFKPDVTMWISGDSCHAFWLKKLSMPVALAKRKIKTKGSLPKILKMIPMLGPAFEAYPDIAKKHGLPV